MAGFSVWKKEVREVEAGSRHFVGCIRSCGSAPLCRGLCGVDTIRDSRNSKGDENDSITPFSSLGKSLDDETLFSEEDIDHMNVDDSNSLHNLGKV